MALFEGFIRSVEIKKVGPEQKKSYPLNVSSIANLGKLDFSPQVNFFVGENGSGKSTLLEAIAIASGLNPEGGSKNTVFETQKSHSSLYENILLTKGVRYPEDSYFLRAESFYNVATAVDKYAAKDFYGKKSLHHQSHGESFFSLIQNRFFGSGLYILDEPEAALSPSRQLSFLKEIDILVKRKSQLVIVTHSPIILAYPGATIYLFSEEGVKKVNYEETEHYSITRSFINNRERMLKILLED